MSKELEQVAGEEPKVNDREARTEAKVQPDVGEAAVSYQGGLPSGHDIVEKRIQEWLARQRANGAQQ